MNDHNEAEIHGTLIDLAIHCCGRTNDLILREETVSPVEVD